MIIQIAKAVLRRITGRLKYQRLFEKLHQISLRGMSIGGGVDTNDSGERNVLKYIYRRFKETSALVIFDVGANVGHYSLLLNSVFGEQVEIFSFEPSCKTYNSLKSNTSDFKNIKQFNFGFGDKNTILTLFTNNDESGLASIYQRRLEHFGIKMDKTEEVEIKTIDSFCLDNKIRHIHLLKLDVEGNEVNVLHGASKILDSGNVDYIQFEFGGCNIDSKTYFQDFFYLLKNNYRIYRIVKDGIYEINQYDEKYEAFITTNYLAERI